MDNLKAIINGHIYTGESIVLDKAVLVAGDVIEALVPLSDVPANATLINAEGSIVAPGLIDLQIYGAGGYLFADEITDTVLDAIGNTILSSGTTGFMLTLATNTLDVYRKALDVVKSNPHPALLGLHFEGPYLNPEKRGAHPLKYIRKPSFKEIADMLEYADGWLKMMTIAPEIFDEETIKLLLDNGVLISAGHSNATADQAEWGFSNGIQAVTHLFNGMSSFHHREPGLPGATFISTHVRAGIIPDGIHVDYRTLTVAKKLLEDRLFLITDAIVESTDHIYNYQSRGDRFTLPDGTLAGTALNQLNGVRNCVEHAGIALAEALRMASLYPAKLANAEFMGRIASGMLANIIIFDEEFRLKKLIYKGEEQNLSYLGMR